MKFEKGNTKVVRGIQKSIWDEYEPLFKNPGDYLCAPQKSEAEPEGLTSQSANQFAKRMSLLTKKPFHSYFNQVDKKFYVRRRLDGELPSKEEQEESSDDSNVNPSDNLAGHGLSDFE